MRIQINLNSSMTHYNIYMINIIGFKEKAKSQNLFTSPLYFFRQSGKDASFLKTEPQIIKKILSDNKLTAQ